MTFSNDQGPTPEFRARLRADVTRAFRTDERFGPRVTAAPPRRLAMGVGVAVGVALTLMTGMVLGASASYASAAVLDEHQREGNTTTIAATRQLVAARLDLARATYDRVHAAVEKGTAPSSVLSAAAADVDSLKASMARIDSDLSASRVTTPPPRSALAMLPIKNTLTVLGCTPSTGAAKSAAAPSASTATPAAAIAAESLTTATRRQDPDRARIVALAAQYVPGVVRGDTAADYVVMVLDAADKYLWSTYGAGNLSLQIGGDARTAEERGEYNRAHRAEYLGDAALKPMMDYDPMSGGYRFSRLGYDSALNALHKLTLRRIGGDSLDFFYRDSMGVRLNINGGARGRGGDSLLPRRIARADSGRYLEYYLFAADSLLQVKPFAGARGGARGGGARGGSAGGSAGGARGDGGGGRGGAGGLLNGASPFNAPDGSYKIGWSSTRNSMANQALGLEESGGGQSGIQGLPSLAVAMGETYVFAAGEIAPAMLKIVVVHLAPGTVWKGH